MRIARTKNITPKIKLLTKKRDYTKYLPLRTVFFYYFNCFPAHFIAKRHVSNRLNQQNILYSSLFIPNTNFSRNKVFTSQWAIFQNFCHKNRFTEKQLFILINLYLLLKCQTHALCSNSVKITIPQ
jgi:hypothetical protein